MVPEGQGPCCTRRDGSRKDGSGMNRSVLAREVDGAGHEGREGVHRPGLHRPFPAVSLASWFSPTRLLAKLPTGGSLGSVGISGSKITMALPRLEGFTRDSRPYQLTAKTAAQDLLKPDNVELSEIRTKMETADKAVVEMTAATGLNHSKADQLVLRDSIVIKSTSGYEGHLSEAVVDMRSGHIVSDKPVEVKLLNGILNANRLAVEGELIRFDGGVTLNMDGRAFSLTGDRSGQ